MLLVTPRYAPLVGGVEQHVHEVGVRLASSGCRVGILTTDPGRGLPAHEEVDGVTIRRVPARPRSRDYYFAPGIYQQIVAGRRDWDVVHVQSYHTFVAPLAMLAALRAGLPYVLTFHGGGHSSASRRMLRRPQRAVLRPLVRRAARLIAVARFEVGLYGAAFGVPVDRFQVISNGVDLPVSASAASAVASQRSEAPLIASVGRLEHYKGHHRILAALPLILAERPDARLWIAGSGEYEAALHRQAVQLGVADRVEIRAIPAHERDRMAAELAGAALVVLLSEYETQPLTVLEAASLGKPVLVADTSGMTELAERGLAVAVPLESTPAAVAAAVLEQLRSPHAPPQVPLPTWDDCASALCRVYEQVVAEHTSRQGGG